MRNIHNSEVQKWYNRVGLPQVVRIEKWLTLTMITIEISKLVHFACTMDQFEVRFLEITAGKYLRELYDDVPLGGILANEEFCLLKKL